MNKFESLSDRLRYLYDLQRRGIKTGLTHTRNLLKACGNPHNHFPSIHIAGTNGKGSTAAHTAALLKAAGLKVGLYTSPHLLRFNERIRINGQPISNEAIAEFIDRHQADFERGEATFFEATTAMAFWYFFQSGIDIAVIETGLGGRLDSTNVLSPVLAIITPIGLDHQKILGHNLAAIAREKAGIIKPATPLVLARQKPAALKVLLETAAVNRAEILAAEPVEGFSLDRRGTTFFWRGRSWFTPLLGRHQARNAILALTAVRHLYPELSPEALQTGLRAVRWPGRLQLMSETPMIYYDVAHNSHGLDQTLKTLQKLFHRKPVGVLAVKTDKNLNDLARTIRGRFESLIVTSEPGEDLMSADTLASRLKPRRIECRAVAPAQIALNDLRSQLKPGEVGLICGSHYIAGAVYREFEFSFDKGLI